MYFFLYKLFVSTFSVCSGLSRQQRPHVLFLTASEDIVTAASNILSSVASLHWLQINASGQGKEIVFRFLFFRGTFLRMTFVRRSQYAGEAYRDRRLTTNFEL